MNICCNETVEQNPILAAWTEGRSRWWELAKCSLEFYLKYWNVWEKRGLCVEFPETTGQPDQIAFPKQFPMRQHQLCRPNGFKTLISTSTSVKSLKCIKILCPTKDTENTFREKKCPSKMAARDGQGRAAHYRAGSSSGGQSSCVKLIQ